MLFTGRQRHDSIKIGNYSFHDCVVFVRNLLPAKVFLKVVLPTFIHMRYP